MRKIIKTIVFSAVVCAGFVSCYRNLNFNYGDADVNNRVTELAEITKEDFEESGVYKDDGVGQKFYDFLDPSAAASAYSVLVITDVHVGKDSVDSIKQSKKLDAYLSSLAPADLPKFCICLGDITNDGQYSQYNTAVKLFQKVVENYKIKFLNVAGNHDLWDQGWEHWADKLYPNTSCYKMETATTAFYFLDTASGVVGDTQYKKLKADFTTQTKDVYVFTHYPIVADESFLFAMRDSTDRNKFLSLLGKQKIKGYYCGHWHKGNEKDLGVFTQYCLESFGEQNKWYVLNIDETTHTAKIKTIKG